MQITIKVKQTGRKQPVVGNTIISIEDIGTKPSAQQLICAIVARQVDEYNSKPLEKNILPFLTEAETKEQLAEGKIGFRSIYNGNKADLELAKQTALQAFEDGMFALFADDEEITTLSQTIELSTATVITFIKLTFLAGSYW